MNSFENSDSRNSDLEKMLWTLMHDFSAKAREFGYHIRVSTPSSWIHLKSLPLEKKIEIFDSFSLYSKVCTSMLEMGHALNDTNAGMWCLFREMGWRPTSDLFDKMALSDVVEVYGPDFRQLFRNMNFFDICSYSLTEIFSYEWTTLYQRDPAITGQLAQTAVGVLNSGEAKTVPVGIDWHYLEEVFSELQHRIHIVHKYISPIFDKAGRKIAFVAVSEGRVTDSKYKNDEQITSKFSKEEDIETRL